MTSLKRGTLIAIEGIDGAGKTTQARRLVRALRRDGLGVGVWREPTDRALGRRAQITSVRAPFLGALYFSLDRRLGRPKLETLLARFDVVVTDRSCYSTLAYQGSALSAAERRRIARLQVRSTILPDRVVLLELSVDAALRRIGSRSRRAAPLERRRTLARTAREYRRLARGRGWVVVPALGSPAEVAHRVRAAVSGSLDHRRRRA